MNEVGTEITLSVIQVLEDLNVSYAVVGSLASSVYGVPRSTLYTDLLADLRREHAVELEKRLQADFYVSQEEITEAIERHASFNLIHFASVFKVDVFVPKQRSFDR